MIPSSSRIEADSLSETRIEVSRDLRLQLDLKDLGGNQSTFPLPLQGEASPPPLPPFPLG